MVSIVIPTYNHAHFLGHAIQSVLDQTYQDWEVLVIDNHSQDRTDEVVKDFKDARIRILKIHNHGVIAASRNLGIREARGGWVAFLDSDDLWYPNKLEYCLQHLEKGFDLVCHGERWLGDGCDREVQYGPESRATYNALLLEGNCISTSAVIVSRTQLMAVDGFCEDEEIVTAEDYDLWLRLAKNGARIGFIVKTLGEYRIHAGNQSRAVLRNMQAVMNVVLPYLTALDKGTLLDRLRARRRKAIVYYSGARGLQNTGQFLEAWLYFYYAVRLWPFKIKFFIAMVMNLLHRKML